MMLWATTTTSTRMEPLDYQPFVHLMDKAHIILTDSGSIHKKAPSLGKSVLAMRGTTEGPVAVEEGTVRLVGSDKDKIQEPTFFFK